MEYYNLAEYLNISEEDVKHLVKLKALPGVLTLTGIEVTIDEIDHWYSKITGSEWKELLGREEIDPLMVEIPFKTSVDKIKLFDSLHKLEREKKIIISNSIKQNDIRNEIIIRFYEILDEVNNDRIRLRDSNLPLAIKSQINTVINSFDILRDEDIILIIDNYKISLKLTNEKANLLQRDREIIKWHLSRFLYLLFSLM